MTIDVASISIFLNNYETILLLISQVKHWSLIVITIDIYTGRTKVGLFIILILIIKFL